MLLPKRASLLRDCNTLRSKINFLPHLAPAAASFPLSSYHLSNVPTIPYLSPLPHLRPSPVRATTISGASTDTSSAPTDSCFDIGAPPKQELLDWWDESTNPGTLLMGTLAATPAVSKQTRAPGARVSPTTQLNSTDDQSDVMPMAEHCYVSHPGSLSCTVGSTRKDPATNTCTISVTTNVKYTGRGSAPMNELVELGWMALEQTSKDQISDLNQIAALPSAISAKDRHQRIVHILERGTIVEVATKMENSFGHVSYVCIVEDRKTKERVQAFFKPSIEGDGEGWHRVPMEVVAYRLNLLLGMDLVPPAAFRSTCDVDWKHFEQGGAFMYWCKNGAELSSVPRREWNIGFDVLLSDTRILDVLIQNSDRHLGNFMFAEHWAQGRIQRSSTLPTTPSEPASQQSPPPEKHRYHSHSHSPSPSASDSDSHRHHHRTGSSGGGEGSEGGGGSGSGRRESGGGIAAAGSGGSSVEARGASPGFTWEGRKQPVLIDHAAGFREDAFVDLTHENAFGTGATVQISATTYMRLRFLDRKTVTNALQEFATPEEIDALLDRKDAILSYFDDLVHSRGFENVVLEDAPTASASMTRQ